MRGVSIGIVGATVATALTLAGCSDHREPTELETPDVVWPDGRPTDDWPNEPAVAALDTIRLNEALAANAGDWSDADLVNLIGVETAKAWAEHADWTTVAVDHVPGPYAYAVVDVLHHEGFDTVVFCTAVRTRSSNLYGTPHASYAAYTAEPTDHRRFTFVSDPPFTQAEQDAYDEQCAATELRVGYFDPAPVPDAELPEEEIIGPADASAYDLD